MSARLFTLPIVLFLALLTGCGREDPAAELEAAVKALQANLEAKDTGAVMKQLHPQFTTADGNDREWARRTMALLFMRHKNVSIIAQSQDSRLDPTYREKGHTDARIALTGAEGLIPDAARQYAVKLEWWRDDGDWKLARLGWE
ncbi:hypothetical protein [Metapseudomonas otitidis]|uniref:hypothetical protein n=1 Tax=Metapseudomonas otitidis TaxID=319939 RepID=UPI0013F68B19|nr:hypothetical protein [Pseudomonas otitidis]